MSVTKESLQVLTKILQNNSDGAAAEHFSIEYFAQVLHKNIPYYLLIGSKSFFFIDQDLDIIQAEILYSQLNLILLDLNNPNLFQIHLDNKPSDSKTKLSEIRDQDIPQKMNLYTLDRQKLVSYFRYGWKSDQMYNQMEVKEPLIYKSRIVVQEDTPTPNLKSILPPEVFQQDAYFNYTWQTFQEYNFLVDKNFIMSQIEQGIFTHKDYKQVQIHIQVSDIIGLAFIPTFGERMDLRYCVQFYADNIVSKEQYWIIEQGPYYKRQNLNDDRSEWTGYEMLLRTSKSRKQVAIIYLRRKYLPPMMENFVDFTIVMYSDQGYMLIPTKDESNSSLKTMMLGIQDMQLRKEIKKLRISLKENIQEDESKQKTKQRSALEIIRQIADSIYSITQIKQVYQKLIKANINGLNLSANDYAYFQNSRAPLGFMPKYAQVAIIVLESIQHHVEKKDELKETVQNFRDRISAQVLGDQLLDTLNLGEYQFGEISALFPDLIAQTYTGQIPVKSDGVLGAQQVLEVQQEEKIWKMKLMRYIAYCLDGGICNQLTISFLQTLAPTTKQIQQVFNWLLYLHQLQGDYQDVPIPTKITQFISNPHSWIYNKQVMISLIEAHYFIEELVTEGESEKYSEFLSFFLLSSDDADIKMAICRHIISYIFQNKTNLSDSERNGMRDIITPLMFVYNSKNRALGTVACAALLNLANLNQEDNKNLILKGDGPLIIMNMLDSPDTQMVYFTLKLLYAICIQKRFLLVFMPGIFKRMVEFLKGVSYINTDEQKEDPNQKLQTNTTPQTNQAQYDPRILTVVCQILQRILTEQDDDFSDLLNQHKKVVSLIVPDDTFYEDNTLQMEALKVLVLMLMKLQQDNIYLEIQNAVFQYIVDLVKNDLDLSYFDKLIDAALHVLIFFLSDNQTQQAQYYMLASDQVFWNVVHNIVSNLSNPVDYDSQQKFLVIYQPLQEQREKIKLEKEKPQK